MTGQVRIRRLDQPGDLGWVVLAHGELYDREYGWDTDFEALVARIVADFTAARGDGRAAWIAERDAERVGCVFCVPDERPGVARLRLLLVHPQARGTGLGHALVRGCLSFARHAGYRTVTLWTNDVLAAARHVYEQAGFRLVASEPHHSFGHDLVSQTWDLDLGD